MNMGRSTNVANRGANVYKDFIIGLNAEKEVFIEGSADCMVCKHGNYDGDEGFSCGVEDVMECPVITDIADVVVGKIEVALREMNSKV